MRNSNAPGPVARPTGRTVTTGSTSILAPKATSSTSPGSVELAHPSSTSFLSSSRQFPYPPADAAFHGPAGAFVRLIEEHTEADAVAVLAQTLVCFGNAVGRGPHFRVEADRHHANLFLVLVGTSSKSRKGISWGRSKSLFRPADEMWAEKCILGGLSSGEGLIAAVDDSVKERRLLVLEPELASVLRVLDRDGNTLSAILRNAWDGVPLGTLTRKEPLRASHAHISLIGHVTRDELVRRLDNTEAANGFANRFLLCCVRRSRLLPRGGNPDERGIQEVGEDIRVALEIARSFDSFEVDFDRSADEMWRAEYERLSEARLGFFGAVTSRAEAQVVRLALIYALMDGMQKIAEPHLKAALALWEYCSNSARFIFGDRLGDPLADNLLVMLRESAVGLTRTEISSSLGRNYEAGRIDRALGTLAEYGLARIEPTDHRGVGRPPQRWIAVVPSLRK